MECMKKIPCLILVTMLFIGMNTVYAREVKNKNEKTEKKDPSKGDKKPGTTDPKTGTVKGKADVAGEDTTLGDPAFHFYTSKKKRPINLEEIYVGAAPGYLEGKGGSNTPFTNGASVNTCYGVSMLDKYLLLEFNSNTDLMLTPNKEWFGKTFSLQPSDMKKIGLGFSEEFSIGVHAVIVGSKNLTLTAGPLFGAKITNLPAAHANGNSYYFPVPLSFTYGFKTNVFIGKHVYCYAEYSNIFETSIIAYQSQPATDISPMVRHTPVNFGTVRGGIGYIFRPWW